MNRLWILLLYISLSSFSHTWLAEKIRISSIVDASSFIPRRSSHPHLYPLSLRIIAKQDIKDITKTSTKLTRDTNSTAISHGSALPLLSNLFSAVAGAIACSFTHSILVPLDVIKTKMQTDFTLATMNTIQVARELVSRTGPASLLDGLSPTFLGYFLQGFCKFGFYEYFKSKISSIYEQVSQREDVNRYRLQILFISSALAEVVACVALCPLETTKIFLVANSGKYRGYSLLRILGVVISSEGFAGLFKGLHYIILRQVPYTCAKLTGYEIISDYMKKKLIKMSSKYQFEDVVYDRLEVCCQLSSGVCAGVLAAFISHPADVLLSRLCSRSANNIIIECIPERGVSRIISTIRCLGIRGCFTGVMPRAFMVGFMTALQFFIYERSKQLFLESSNRKLPNAISKAKAEE
jgi:solute carrier family 25 (mitochondrial phosphate transporter), member 3